MKRPARLQGSLPLRLLWAMFAMAMLASACASDDIASSPTAAPTTQAGTVSEPASSEAPTPTTTEPVAVETTEQTAETAPAADEAETADDEPDPPYQRIVSISPTGTEILYAIGAGDWVVAVDSYSYFPPEAPVTDLSAWNPNVEAIATYDPDLVVMRTDGDVIASLEALGIAVLLSDAPNDFDDVYAQMALFGATLGLAEEADQFIASMQSQIAALVDSAPDASGLSYYHELTDSLYSVTGETFVGHVYSLFGLESVADPADPNGDSGGYPQLSAEYLLDADPDLIFLADTVCCGQNADTVAARPGWDLLTAVRNGHVIELNDDIVSRWGPRLVDFVAAISEALVSVGTAN